MSLLTKLILVVILAVLAIWCFRKLIFACYNFKDLRQAEKHPTDFPQNEHIVFNKETGQLEEDSRPVTKFDNY